MKKILHFYGLLLMMVLCGALTAQAVDYTHTITWDNPGAVKVYKYTSTTAPLAEYPNDASGTSCTITYSAMTSVYVVPADGFTITSGLTNNTLSQALKTSSSIYGFDNWIEGNKAIIGDKQFLQFSISMAANYKNTSTVLETVSDSAIEDAQFTLNIENGYQSVKAYFNSSDVFELHNGANTIDYQPAIDKTLTIEWQKGYGGSNIYSVTNGGTAVASTDGGLTYKVTDIAPNSTVSVRVFENDSDVPHEVALTLNVPDGCINSIRNWTASAFLPEPFTSPLTLMSGTDLQFNLNEDFTYNSFTLGDTDITDAYTPNSSGKGGTIRFVVDDNTSFTIDATAKEYAMVPVKTYIMNPEGVNIQLGAYNSGSWADLSNGTPISSSITLPAKSYSEGVSIPEVTFTPADTYEYNIEVSEKTPNYFPEAKEGWYIEVVRGKDSGVSGELLGTNMITTSNAPVYIVARRKVANAKVTVDITSGFGTTYFTSTSSINGLWGNENSTLPTLTEGTHQIPFVGGLDDPFQFRTINAPSALKVFMDGRVVPADDNGNYPLAVYNGDAATYADGSFVKIYSNGGEATTYSTVVTFAAGGKADIYYSHLHRAWITNTGSRQVVSLLAGTAVAIKPLNDRFSIIVDDETVYSTNHGIGSLNEEGEYVFTPTAATKVVVAQEALPYEITEYTPADGAFVKSFETFKITLPMLEEEHMFYPDSDVLAAATLALEGSDDVFTLSGLGEIEPTLDGTGLVYSILFEDVTAEGKYTLTLPEGAFTEAIPDAEADLGFSVIDGGYATKELTTTFTIDATLCDYLFTPGEHSQVSDLSKITIAFPGAGEVTFNEGSTITLTGDDFSATPFEVNDVYGGYPLAFDMTFANKPVTEGRYTLTIPAGAFTIDGEASEAVSTWFDFKPIWTLDPAPGSTVDSFDSIILEFPDATEAEFVGTQHDIFIANAAQTYASTGFTCEALSATKFKLSIFPTSQLPAMGPVNFLIEAGAFKVDGKDNPEIAVSYTYEKTVSAEYTTMPAGQKVLISEWGTTFGFIFDASSVLSAANDCDSKTTVLINDSPLGASGYMYMVGYPESHMVMFMLSDTPEPGDVVTIKMEAGAFNIKGTESTPSPAIDRSWTCIEETVPEMDAIVAEGATIGTFTELYLSFPGAESVVFNPNFYGSITLSNGATSYNHDTVEIIAPESGIATYSLYAEENAGAIQAKITFKNLALTSGSCTLQVPTRAFLVDELLESPALTRTFTVDTTTGIDSIGADANGNYTVYGIDGMVILRGAAMEAVKNLAPGIYIINGTKAAIR